MPMDGYKIKKLQKPTQDSIVIMCQGVVHVLPLTNLHLYLAWEVETVISSIILNKTTAEIIYLPQFELSFFKIVDIILSQC